MHHLICGIGFLLRSVNAQRHSVHCAPGSPHPARITPHCQSHLRSHCLSIPRPFTPKSRLISFTYPFLGSLPGSFCTAFLDLEPVYRSKWALVFV